MRVCVGRQLRNRRKAATTKRIGSQGKNAKEKVRAKKGCQEGGGVVERVGESMCATAEARLVEVSRKNCADSTESLPAILRKRFCLS